MTEQAQILTKEALDFWRSVGLTDPNRQRVSEAFGDLWTAAENFQAIMTDIEAEREAKREEAHDAACIEGRAQLEMIDKTEGELIRVSSMAVTAAAAVSDARVALAFAKDAQPNPDRFPTRSEVRSWRESVRIAEENHEKVMDELRHTEALLASLRMREQEEKAKLRELQEREFSLRPAAEKAVRTVDPVTGLGFRHSRGLGDGLVPRQLTS